MKGKGEVCGELSYRSIDFEMPIERHMQVWSSGENPRDFGIISHSQLIKAGRGYEAVQERKRRCSRPLGVE